MWSVRFTLTMYKVQHHVVHRRVNATKTLIKCVALAMELRLSCTNPSTYILRRLIIVVTTVPVIFIPFYIIYSEFLLVACIANASLCLKFISKLCSYATQRHYLHDCISFSELAVNNNPNTLRLNLHNKQSAMYVLSIVTKCVYRINVH